MAADIDYVRINKNPMQRKQWEISFYTLCLHCGR